MKSFITIAALLFSQVALAATSPQEGDQAVFEIIVAGKVSDKTITQTIVDLNAVTVTVNTTVKANGQITSSENDVSSADELKILPRIFSQCALYGGSMENITVPAGTFKTCKINSSGSSIYINDSIPLGVVKTISVKGNIAHLKSYTKN